MLLGAAPQRAGLRSARAGAMAPGVPIVAPAASNASPARQQQQQQQQQAPEQGRRLRGSLLRANSLTRRAEDVRQGET